MYSTLEIIKEKNLGQKHWEEIRKIILKEKTGQDLKKLNITNNDELFANRQDPKYTLKFLY